MYDTIQYAGEILLENDKQAYETLIRVFCNDESFLVFTSTLYYLSFPDKVDSIDLPAHFCNTIFFAMFAQCETLERICMHQSVTCIQELAFAGCENLKEVIFSPNINEIPKQAFTLCTSLEEIHIPANIHIVGEAAFERCKKLRHISMDDGIQRIDFCAFFNCESLKSIYIPRSVVSMGAGVFLECNSLTDVFCEVDEKPEGWDENWLCCNAKVHWGVDR